MAALRSHTMVTGKDDLTKASGIGYAFGTMCGKPPCGCPECIDGSSRYHQSELGFVDGLRSLPHGPPHGPHAAPSLDRATPPLRLAASRRS